MANTPVSKLHFPQSNMRGCIFWGVERDTRGIALSDAQRFNYYPASPLPTISWTFQGVLRMVLDPYSASTPEMGPPLPRVLFAGPHTRPSASWSAGEVHAMSVTLLPETLHRLFGVRMESLVDKILPLESVVTGPLLDKLQVIAPSPVGDTFQCIEKVFEPHWKSAVGEDSMPTIHGWISSLAQRAAFSELGIGVRQLQRKLKQLTGQSQRDLQIYARTEKAMICLADLNEDSPVELADLAAEAGFSDQSHMGREIRRVSGMSPGQLEALMRTDEAFWFYRLLRSGLQGHSNFA